MDWAVSQVPMKLQPLFPHHGFVSILSLFFCGHSNAERPGMSSEECRIGEQYIGEALREMLFVYLFGRFGWYNMHLPIGMVLRRKAERK